MFFLCAKASHHSPQNLLDNLQNMLLTKESSEADLRRRLLADVAASKEELTALKQQLEEVRAERERERKDADGRQRQLALLVEAKEKQASDVRLYPSSASVVVCPLCKSHVSCRCASS